MDADQEQMGEDEEGRWQWLCGNACHSSNSRQQLYGPLLFGMFLEYRAKRSIRCANQSECVCVCCMPLTGAHNY